MSRASHLCNLNRMEMVRNRIWWMGSGNVMTEGVLLRARALAIRAALLKSCSEAGVSHCKGVCLFFHIEDSFKGHFFLFLLWFSFGQHKRGEQREFRTSFLATGHSVDNLSSQVPVKCWSAPLRAQCTCPWRCRQSWCCFSNQDQLERDPFTGQKETCLSKVKKRVWDPIAGVESRSSTRLPGFKSWLWQFLALWSWQVT